MKKKEWKYQIIRGENKVEKSADDVFYTSDTEAFLVFKLEDPRLAPRQALLNLYNQNDGSVVSETVLVEDGVIEWEMREEVIVHAGNWQVQVIYEQLKDGKPEKYTAPIINFPVKNDLLNQKTTRLIAVENWHRLITNAGELIDDWEQLEEIRQTNEQQRELAESARETAESVRVANEEERSENEQVRIENEEFREKAEGKRQSTFEENEQTRQMSYEEAESGRDSEYAARVTDLEEETGDARNSATTGESYSTIGKRLDEMEVMTVLENHKAYFEIKDGRPRLRLEEI